MRVLQDRTVGTTEGSIAPERVQEPHVVVSDRSMT